MSKLFTVAGTSVLGGVCKFRVANGGAAARAKVLEKNGHTDIALQDLPKPMTKDAAMAFLNYVEGTTAKVAKPAAAPKAKAAPKVVEKEFKIERKAPAAEKAPEDVENIRAKNLETMRAVTLKHKALEKMHQEARDELALIEAETAALTRDDIPQIFWKECGLAE
jgi:hypothetical protein